MPSLSHSRSRFQRPGSTVFQGELLYVRRGPVLPSKGRLIYENTNQLGALRWFDDAEEDWLNAIWDRNPHSIPAHCALNPLSFSWALEIDDNNPDL